MNPQATWNLFLQLCHEGDRVKAGWALRDLRDLNDWFDKGGSRPKDNFPTVETIKNLMGWLLYKAD